MGIISRFRFRKACTHRTKQSLDHNVKYSIDQLKYKDQKELGIDFFFDFVNRLTTEAID